MPRIVGVESVLPCAALWDEATLVVVGGNHCKGEKVADKAVGVHDRRCGEGEQREVATE